jgi:hypothetical protein
MQNFSPHAILIIHYYPEEGSHEKTHIWTDLTTLNFSIAWIYEVKDELEQLQQ